MDSDMNFSEELLNMIKEGQSNDRVKEIVELFFLHYLIDLSGATLLHYSVRYNNPIITQYLVDEGCDVNMQDSKGMTPLMIAITENRYAAVKILLAANADIFKVNNEGKNALQMLSVQHDMPLGTVRRILGELQKNCFTSEELAEKLISANFHIFQAVALKDPNVIDHMILCNRPGDYAHITKKFTTMHAAVVFDDYESVKVLLKHGYDSNVLDISNETPLYNLYRQCTKHNSSKIEILNVLLDRGAEMTTCTSQGFFQVHYTLTRGNRKALSVLLKAKIGLKAKDDHRSSNVLHYLASNNDPEIVEELEKYRRNFHINTRDIKGQTALFISAVGGNVSMVKFLLKHGAKTELRHRILDTTPLYCVYANTKPHYGKQYQKCGKLLLDSGADPQFVGVNKRNGETLTIFDNALKLNRFNRIKPVVEHLAMIDKFGKPITETTWEKINSHEYLKGYFITCRESLEQKICEQVELFHLIAGDKRKIAKYLNNEKVVEKLKDKSCKSKMKRQHWYFYRILRKSYLKGKRFLKLKNEVAGIICSFFENRIDEKNLIVDKIIEFLDDQSLRTLLRSMRS